MNSRPKYDYIFAALFAAGLLLVAFRAQAQTEPAGNDPIAGKWEVSQTFGERKTYSALEITKGAGDALTATWNGQPLENVKFAAGKLSFERKVTFGDQQNTIEVSGMLKDGTIDGVTSSSFGSFPLLAARPKPLSPAVGVWQTKIKLGDREIANRLQISQDDAGKLSATITSTSATHTVTNVQFADGKLTFDRTTKINDIEWQSKFAGTVKDGQLTGAYSSDQGEIPVTAESLSAQFAGVWQLTGEFQFGGPTRTLRIDPDLSGRYQLFDGLSSVDKITVAGNKLTFEIEAGFGDNTFTLKFAGTLENNELKGEITTPRGTTAVTGKKAG